MKTQNTKQGLSNLIRGSHVVPVPMIMIAESKGLQDHWEANNTIQNKYGTPSGETGSKVNVIDESSFFEDNSGTMGLLLRIRRVTAGSNDLELCYAAEDYINDNTYFVGDIAREEEGANAKVCIQNDPDGDKFADSGYWVELSKVAIPLEEGEAVDLYVTKEQDLIIGGEEEDNFILYVLG